MKCRWIYPPASDPAVVRELSHAFHLPEFIASLLINQGFSSEEIADFLSPRLRNLSDPFLLPEMHPAVERIESALRRNERIVLYGDYDVDGVSSVAILYRLLHAYGGRVDCFLPIRVGEGYGLSAAAVDRCLEQHHPSLLIAVDCGTNSVEEIARLRSAGVDVVILDHHEVASTRPDCTALVNPKLGRSEFSYLCSAGIAFKAAHALLKSTPLPGFDLRTMLDLVAMATICDLVPLVRENRTLVRHGLLQMEKTVWPGLAALKIVSKIQSPIRSTDVGFRLGPRINASGRLGTAEESLHLLLTNDPLEAMRIAASLDNQNRQRQTVERSVATEVETWIDANFRASQHRSIVVGQKDWHTGVLGIVASRIMRRHYRPTLIIGFDGNGDGKGSGRSVEGLSLVEALARCAEHLGNFGGHEMAAGLNVREADFSRFRQAFEAAIGELICDEMLIPSTRLHAELSLDEQMNALLEAQSHLEPFGAANPQPTLFARRVVPKSPPRILKEKHLRLELPAGRSTITAIYFNGSTVDLPKPPWDVAFHLERNDWNGRTTPQLQIVDIRAAS